MSPTGVLGDPAGASAEEGAALLADAGRAGWSRPPPGLAPSDAIGRSDSSRPWHDRIAFRHPPSAARVRAETGRGVPGPKDGTPMAHQSVHAGPSTRHGGAHPAGRRRDQRHQRHRRGRAQGHAAAAVLALVRRQRQRLRPGLRLVPAGLRHLVLAGRRRRRRRHRRLVPALRPDRHRRQARLGADAGAQPRGVRRQRQPGALGALLGAHRRLGDRAGLAGHAGDRAGLRPARLERRDGDQGRRPARRGRARRGRRRARLRRHHAHAGGHHLGDRHPDRRLHRARRRPHGLVRGLRACPAARPPRSSARWCWP